MIETIVIGFVLFVLALAGGLSLFCIRKIQPGRAGIKTGWGGVKVAFDWMVRVPMVQNYHIVDISVKKLEITRKGKTGPSMQLAALAAALSPCAKG